VWLLSSNNGGSFWDIELFLYLKKRLSPPLAPNEFFNKPTKTNSRIIYLKPSLINL
jgi:hypothetical protein